MTGPLVGDVVDLLERRYPPRWASDWDVVGLAVGSRSWPVTTVQLAVEVAAAVVEEAISVGAEVIIAHHPLLLRGMNTVDTDTPKGALVAELLRTGIAVVVAHTNADVAPGGVVDALADLLDIGHRRPLRPYPAEPLDKVITFIPPDRSEGLIDALAAAGAGRLGDYERCAFTAPGTGTFRPLNGAQPFLGEVGQIERVAETRVEMVLPRRRRAEVVSALYAHHPYETPAFDIVELADSPSEDTGLGRVGDLPEPVRLAEFARHVSDALPSTASGIRVAGDRDRLVRRIAVQAGAGDDLLGEARRAQADVYLTSDLRHHPAGDALAWPDAPALIDVPHWAAEWTWLPVVERLIADTLRVRTHVSHLVTDPWSLHLP